MCDSDASRDMPHPLCQHLRVLVSYDLWLDCVGK